MGNKYRIISLVMLITLLGTTVYAKSATMTESNRDLTPKPDQALIIFIRASNFGCAISSSIFDVSSNETKFIGVFKSGVKVAYDVAPGEHVFMVVGESADFMKATMSPGKTYYALVVPRTGAMKARFTLKPLHYFDLASDDFAKWDSKTKLVENTPETVQWAKDNAADIEGKRTRWWAAWSTMPPQKQEELTLYDEDGR